MRKRSVGSRGVYHIALIITVATAFNWAFLLLTGVNLATRLAQGITIPSSVLAVVVCASSVIVLWKNWAD